MTICCKYEFDYIKMTLRKNGYPKDIITTTTRYKYMQFYSK